MNPFSAEFDFTLSAAFGKDGHAELLGRTEAQTGIAFNFNIYARRSETFALFDFFSAPVRKVFSYSFPGK